MLNKKNLEIILSRLFLADAESLFLLIPQMFIFESLTPDGNALCSGESVILQEEFNPLVSKLRQHNMLVTAFHNHWLFDHPRLMYIHFLKIDNSTTFAQDVKDSFKVLPQKRFGLNYRPLAKH